MKLHSFRKSFNVTMALLKQTYLLLFLLWLGGLLAASILLFSSGFLLTRTATDLNATYFAHPENNVLDMATYLAGIADKPGQSHRQGKVVLLIIDALRYDFAEHNSSKTKPLPYENKLPIIHHLLTAKPKQSRLYRFIADPPTTTMQRLKGITTGSLPTFIDAGSNFASSEINEDNIIDQVLKTKQKIICMGDDTWGNLFPGRFKRKHLYPSFNVWDLDTVDSGVRKHLFVELERNDWDLIIGHFLGVDHCGHRYGPDHPEMARKLSEMNVVLRDVINKMDSDTTLIVIGDHGMTANGDHGGESSDEVTAAMFVHTSRMLSDFVRDNNTIKQVDLVPTLATILGVPIPYSNLGTIVVDLLPSDASIRTKIHALWANVWQVHTYVETYANMTDTFSSESLELNALHFKTLREAFLNIRSESDYAPFVKQAQEYIATVRNACEEMWVQFDAFSISRGLLLSSFLSVFAYLIIDGFTSKNLSKLINKMFILQAYCGILSSFVIATVIYYIKITENFVNTVYFAGGLFGVAYLAYFVGNKFESIAVHLHANSKNRTCLDITSRIIVALTFLMLFTNSYIVEESKVTLFMTVTLLVMILFDLRKFKVKRATKHKLYGSVLLVCLLLKLTTYYWGCRDANNCLSTLSKWGSSTRLELCVALVVLSFFVTVSKLWLRSCGNLAGYSLNSLLSKYLPTVIVVACGGFWVLNHVPQDRLVVPWQREILAWTVFVMTTVALVQLSWNPLHVYWWPGSKASSGMTVEPIGNVIPQLFRQIKENFGVGRADESSDADSGASGVPIVYGMATVYSSAFLVALLYVVLLVSLVLGDVVAPSLIMIVAIATLIVLITSVARFEACSSVATLYQVPAAHVVLWFVFSIYAFYATRHQPTFTSIVWEAASVGTTGGGNLAGSHVVPGALVLLNTFGTYLILGMALPLLAVAPYTVYAMMPSLASAKKHDVAKDLSKGDFNLYDFEQPVGVHVFTVCCKYVLLHSIRVFGCMLSATIHSRHLMVWAIFAPKFIFEAVALFVTIVAVLVGYVLFMRVGSALNAFVTLIQKSR